MDFRRTWSGVPWEKEAGYCRAVRAGNHIYVSGTCAVTEEGTIHAPGDSHAQTARCLSIIEKALVDLGAGRYDIVRTRIFVTDASKWREIGRAHSEFFGNHPPALTLVQVAALVHPDFVVEVEAEAVTES